MKDAILNKLSQVENSIKENERMNNLNNNSNNSNNSNNIQGNNNIMKSLFEARESEALNSKNQATKKDKAKLMLEKMGWKGQGKSYFVLNLISY